jgi:TonB family protein
MRNAKVSLIVLFAVILAGSQAAEGQDTPTLGNLQAKFQQQYEAIQDIFAHGPAKKVYPPRFQDRLRLWQAELSQSFARAGATTDEILKLHPTDEARWLELRETMWVYAQPNSRPEKRTIFGSSEVQKRAHLNDTPAATYPDQARAAKTEGEVRLDLVLAADGPVKHIFPMNSLPNGLTEAAIDAARRIKFTPAVRNGQPVSQFEILSYEFKKGKGMKPYHPEPAFYF